MNDERKATIIREIDHWRRSKLLPDQYCDFLLNLYADPDDHAENSRHASGAVVGKAVAAVQNATGKQWLLTFGTFTLISFVVLYFSRFHPALQIAVVLIAVIAFLRTGMKLKRRNEAASLTFTSIGMLVLLGGGLHMLELHGLTDWGYRSGLLGGCALFWVVYGIRAKIHSLHLCGWLVMLLLYGWLLSRFTDTTQWFEVQLFWIPLAILFGWSSWFFHRWTKPVSAVLFVTCALAWFMPELYTAVVLKYTVWLQLQLLVKIAIGGGLLFALRKQWMVWVA
ncbi:hypothetical protein RB620_16870 [Paenibacillus sp. LHD-117]|uniref:hypothetical protein n=1 Tax=Paenibacillus sp. LHD-117 TaxID=3071412 RepID=UPI0027E0A551|nr:hypothetical protein [Paenibacillus sp. LHD-117]MDQ6421102.1 hypothetical protein [Paenibacillus sp. LHD-117]